MKTIGLFFVLLFFLHHTDAQLTTPIQPTANGQSPDFIPASPNAAGLGTFGQIPMSNYTGLPQINIPLYNIQYKELNLALGLSYNPAANKPDNFPGSLGLGWSMDAPGAISRVVKGRVDEGADLSLGSQPVASITVPYTDDRTWNTPTYNWSSSTYLATLLATNSSEETDKSDPDEYYFNFNGMSGRFYFDQLGQFHIKSASSPQFRIEREIVNFKTFPVMSLPGALYNTVYKDRVINKFSLIDGNGIKYTFGGIDYSIEFSRPGFNRDYVGSDATILNNNINPITWYLTLIESPNGYKIEMIYQPGVTVTKAAFTEMINISGSFTQSHPTPVANGTKSTLINTAILSKIITPKEEVDFLSSEANQQLDYTNYEKAANEPGSSIADPRNFSWFKTYGDVGTTDMRHKFPFKLDNILVKDKSARTCRTINFGYTANTGERLKLISLQIMGTEGTKEAYPVYLFTYNNMQLPPYLSFETDHYGFYNGPSPYTFLDQNAYITVDKNAYFASREANPNYVQAEILTKIVYPTGGNTEFLYEPNKYSSYFTTWPFQSNLNPGNSELITGGVRIYKIISHDIDGGLIGQKTYHYIKNYAINGTISSGVKAFKPTYFEDYTFSGPISHPATLANGYYSGGVHYYKFSVNPIYPMGETRGSHITYSEVTEENADGSFVVYKYKNYDNGYGDIEPISHVSDNLEIKAFFKEDEGISMDLERGQLTSEEYFDSNKSSKKKIEYQYNNDPARFNDHVRVISHSFNSPSDYNIPSRRFTASLIYTYFPYLREKTETDNNNNGTSTTVTSFAYDVSRRNLKETTSELSDGSIIKVINRYPADVTHSVDVYQAMLNQNITNPVIENEKQIDGVKQFRSISEYSTDLSPNNNLILLSANKYQQQNNVITAKYNIDQYDDQGNVLSITREKGRSICYVWGYTGLYPIAKIENADYADIISILGGVSSITSFRSQSYPSFTDVITFLAPLRTDIRLKDAFVTNYIYDPMAGLTTSIDAKEISTYYEYDGMQRLKAIRDQNNNITKYFCYNYAGQNVDCNNLTIIQTDFSYVENLYEICSVNSPHAMVTAYSYYGGGIYYRDRSLTIPVKDGYYASQGGDWQRGHTKIYRHLESGIETGLSSCTIH